MRIAFLTPYLPCPANTGGRIRMYQLAKALAAESDLTLFSCGGPREAKALAQSQELRIYKKTYVRNNDIGCVAPLLNAQRVRRSCPLRLFTDLWIEHKIRPFSLLVCEHSYAVATTRAAPGVPFVVDEHNVESAYASQYDAAQQRQHWLAQREHKLLSQWEKSVWNRAHLVTCVSEADASVIEQSTPEAPVRIVPNGVSLQDVPFHSPSERTGYEILFVGLLSHAPNEFAATFLAREVMPLVWKQLPSATLVLCGRQPSKQVLELQAPRVQVTGTVPSVIPYLDRAAVYANALFHGAGSSLKVLEALAAGIPLVSTSVGVRGYPLLPDEHFSLAETAESFAHALVQQLQNRASLDHRARIARSIAERFDWEPLSQRFAQLCLAVAQKQEIPL